MSYQGTFYWYDYETFGADARVDRISQFAGIRTDADLNIIGEPDMFYCRQAEDYLPDPIACLVTGITPQQANREGLSEVEFARRISDRFSEPGTCVLGYNSIRFDDEFTRNLFYRNFIDPYAREYKNGNSRWDLIDVVRLTHALRPEGIKWPKKEDGTTSFRLEELTVANGIGHENAHDALSDVYATIAIAKLVKDNVPKLFDYAFSLRNKQTVFETLSVGSNKPVLHISSMFGAERGCMALVLPLCADQTNANAIHSIDLSFDPDLLEGLSVEEIQRRVFTSQQELGETPRIPFKTIHANKSPMVVAAKMMTDELAQKWGHDLNLCRQNWKKWQSKAHLLPIIQQAFAFEGSEETDVDRMIYSGFFPRRDKEAMDYIGRSDIEQLDPNAFSFQDIRCPELLFRCRARSYPDALTDEERMKWEQHKYRALMEQNYGAPRCLSNYPELLNKAHLEFQDRADAQFLLEELMLYAQSIAPFDSF
ncbi:exodeoxyribonuclease I [Litoribrevibacter albus]|uniref:Exodeoxyribonuclease I n=1 Tax=Litoribrevibacter albus TaxID=1473156 RepID=A0AA37W9F6_9GAMM|nr:exodeoxyribonuclease I [Litoribrevibacter albus]GLQ33403.1 exodeoxyribonuclease I [Litoribrevibacter albus]